MRKKLLSAALAGLFACVLAISACGGTYRKLAYSTGINAEGKYDSSLFYRNDLLFDDAADPGALYEDGYFYLYPTGAPIRVYRTKDFARYEYLGFAFMPSDDSWAYGNYWGPEVVKNPADGKYYMYYCASSKTAPEGAGDAGRDERMRLGVAVADKPEGPFAEWTGTRHIETRDAQGAATGWKDEEISVADPLFDFTQGEPAYRLLQGKTAKIFATIDASPFFDEDGTLYLYFVKHTDRNQPGNSIWGVKMHDMVTPDYDTLTQLTEPGKITVGGNTIYTEVDNASGAVNTINEGPNMLRHTTRKGDGTSVTKYYLSFSIYGYGDRRYSVCTAVADSPLGYAEGAEAAPYGGFVKLPEEYGQPMHGIDLDFDHMSGTGHHVFVEAEGELFIVYHAHKDRVNGGTLRAIAADRAAFVYNDALGFDLIHSNGPTYSLQPVPGGASGYKNIASEAAVSATNAMAGSREKLLNDGLTAIHAYDEGLEWRSCAGGTTITLEFAQSRDVRAVMIYNSRDYDLAFSKIDSIVFDNEYCIENLAFPEAYVAKDMAVMRPGGAAVAEFKEMKVKKITIRISEKISAVAASGWEGIAVSDIAVLGK